MMNKDIVILRIEEILLKKGRILDLSGFGLNSIPDEVSQLDNLEILNLSNNKIDNIESNKIPKGIKILDLRNNNIKSIGRELLSLEIPIKFEFDYGNNGIYLSGNTLDIPIDIIKQGNNAIESYLTQVNKAISKVYREAKISLIGDGGAGKTSLVRKLTSIKTEIDPYEKVTEGIQITKHYIQIQDKSIKLNIWDFGGQEIMHSTHLLFLSRRTVYLLVIDTRREGNIIYWLQTVQAFAGNVPIVIVLNKTDQNPNFDLNRKQLHRKYPNIVAFHKISCLTNEGIPALLHEIKSIVNGLQHVHTEIPASWFNVREEIESLKKDFINFAEFRDICKKNGIIDTSNQNFLSAYLHDIGAIIHFKNIPLYSTLILNPQWITDAIYQIINSKELTLKQGKIDLFEISDILTPYNNIYPKSKSKFIIDVMNQFELLFKINENSFIIPQLLPVLEPDIDFNESDSLTFIYSFDFLPASLFPRILVNLQEWIKYDNIWRYGVYLSRNQSEAVLYLDLPENKIVVRVNGKERKEFLFLIREIIDKLNISYSNISVDEFVTINNSGVQINYKELFLHFKAKRESIFIGQLGEELTIKKTIEDFEPDKKRELNPIKIFISYSHKDKDFKSELLSHISPLVRLNKVKVWEDGKIMPGQEWNSEILSNLENSDIVLCLISADFIASNFCYSIELKEALEAHWTKRKIVIPILIRKCYWKELEIAKIQGIPQPPVSSQNNIDEAWSEVIEGVNKSLILIKDIKYGSQQ